MKQSFKFTCLSILAVIPIMGIVFVSTAFAENKYDPNNKGEISAVIDIHSDGSRINPQDKDVNSSEASPKSAREGTLLESPSLTKSDIYHAVLNSVDNYDCASGVIKTNFLNGNDATIEYSVDMVNNKAYQHVFFENEPFDEETYVGDGSIIVVDNTTGKEEMLGRTYSKSEDTQNYSDDRNRVTLEEGIPTYYYRLNPTNLHYASTVSIFPQEMAFGFLSNTELWDIDNITTYLGRECVSISGTTEKSYKSRLAGGS